MYTLPVDAFTSLVTITSWIRSAVILRSDASAEVKFFSENPPGSAPIWILMSTFPSACGVTAVACVGVVVGGLVGIAVALDGAVVGTSVGTTVGSTDGSSV